MSPWAVAVSSVALWWRIAREVPLAHVGQGHPSSIGRISAVCLLKPVSLHQHMPMNLSMHVRRFRGPVGVSATPNLAVLVGNTQSAYSQVKILLSNRCNVYEPCQLQERRTPVGLYNYQRKIVAHSIPHTLRKADPHGIPWTCQYQWVNTRIRK